MLVSTISGQLSRRCCIARGPSFGDQPENRGEQPSRDRDLGHSEGESAVVGDERPTDPKQISERSLASICDLRQF
jgi:hypothetical protein